MKKMWSTTKDKMFDWKTNRAHKEALKYIQKNEKLEQHIAELQGSYTAEIMEPTIKNDDKSQKKEIHNEPPVALKEEENSRSKDKSEKTFDNETNAEIKELNENKKDTIHFKNKRPRKRSTKRCHLCRKRGHIQKECPFSPVLQNWL